MKKLLQATGALALVLWTGLGLAAWLMTKEQVRVVVSPDAPEAGADPVALLAEEVGAVERDLAALTETLGSNFSILDERVSKAIAEAGGREPAAERDLRIRIAELEARLAVMEAAVLGKTAEPARGADTAGASDQPTESAPAEPAPQAAPEPAASFLAFELPSKTFELDQRRRWTIVGSLSRVGFDGKSSLHDFTGATTAVSGELVANPARPDDRPEGKVVVDARRLDTGLDDRDREMQEHLASERFGTFEFVLEGFDLERAAAEGAAFHGTARGRMKIRGVERAFAMPVTVAVDEDHRLVIEGSAPLLLSDFEVPVPNKLGLVKMEDEVAVWVVLRARPGAEVRD